MNYVAFASISDLDNLYVRATDKLKCTKELRVFGETGILTAKEIGQLLSFKHKKD